MFFSNRKWGIETEYHDDIDCNKILDTLIDIGINCNQVEYEKSINNNDWRLKEDGSCGFELVSPVFSKFENIYEVIAVIDSIKNKFKRQKPYDETCGLHIHINRQNICMAFFTSWFIKFEHILFSMQPKHRRCNIYCLLKNKHHLNYNTSRFKSKITTNTRDSIGFQHPYTVEFRMSEMSLDSYYISKWIILLHRIVDIFGSFGYPKNLNWMDLDTFCEYLQLNYEMKKFIVKRILKYKKINNSKIIKQANEILEKYNNKKYDENYYYKI